MILDWPNSLVRRQELTPTRLLPDGTGETLLIILLVIIESVSRNIK